jgi:hypothetical protein
MMRKTIRSACLAVCLALAGLQQAAAQPAPPPGMGMGGPPPCYAGQLRNSSGQFISLVTGLRFQVLPGAGRTAVTTWLPLDKVQVCHGDGSGYEITNLSRPHPSTVKVLRLNN